MQSFGVGRGYLYKLLAYNKIILRRRKALRCALRMVRCCIAMLVSSGRLFYSQIVFIGNTLSLS